MKIMCLVKFVPDVGKFKFDIENHRVDRKNVRQIINPEDACAVGFALDYKERNPDTLVEVVSMGPKTIVPMVSDLIRLGVNKVHMICDSSFAGSDTYATSLVLGKFLKEKAFDCILTGSHAIDGDTSHVPSQVADLLDLDQMSNVVQIKDLNETNGMIIVEGEHSVLTYTIKMPGIISLNKESKYKMPYIKKENFSMKVDQFIHIISNEDLLIPEDKLGIKGSLTKVNRTYVKEYGLRDKTLLTNNQEGIESVYKFLKKHGYIDRQGAV